jgi:NADH-quinone oxidoreductase subunit M
MGIPGFSGFAAEITILIGVWKTYPVAVWITGAGMVLVAAFTLRALKRSFFDSGQAGGGSSSPLLDAETQRALAAPTTTSLAPPPMDLEPITLAEKCGAGLLMLATVTVGIYPKLLLDRIIPAVESMRFLKP